MLSDAGYATAYYAKWHLGDIPESYCHNQAFDESLVLPYNQVKAFGTRWAMQRMHLLVRPT